MHNNIDIITHNCNFHFLEKAVFFTIYSKISIESEIEIIYMSQYQLKKKSKKIEILRIHNENYYSKIRDFQMEIDENRNFRFNFHSYLCKIFARDTFYT